MAPYRVPLFEGLSKDVDLKVFFGKSTFEDRFWDVDKSQNYKYELLWEVGEFFLFSTINPSLPLKLLLSDFDVYMGADANLFGTQMSYLASRLRGKPFILWTEERDYSWQPQRSQLKRWIFDRVKATSIFVTRHSDACVALGEEAKKRLVRLGVPKEKIFVGPNALPICPLREAYENSDPLKPREELGISPDTKVILSLSYLREVKGVQYLIRAFERLRKERGDVKLVIAGAGPYLDELKSIQKDRKIPGIIFRGYLPEEEKPEYYKMADVFVLPTLRDPWGLTINEAMICERPILTTEGAGAKELVKDNGVIVPSGDEEALYEALQSLLADEESLRIKSMRSWEIVQDYSIENELRAFMAAISHVHEKISKR